ncbi:hypothetical protein T492DRAFT_276466 [Pavlovales sp. CCMP2436]|nr:hypothetical protein T492DRAFT_276466 [Pavlovales sp. CCMP2436]
MQGPQFTWPHVLDDIFLGADAGGHRPPGKVCSRREPTWVTASKTTAHRAGILVANLADFARPSKPSWIGGGVRVHKWRQTVSTTHLSLLRAHHAHWVRQRLPKTQCTPPVDPGSPLQPPRCVQARGGGMAHIPHTEAADELCVVLDGKLDYALGTSGRCGEYNLLTAETGFINFLPTGVYHTSSPSLTADATELCISFATRNHTTLVSSRHAHSASARNVTKDELKAFTHIALAADKLCALDGRRDWGGTEPQENKAFETPLWQLGDRGKKPQLGYGAARAFLTRVGGLSTRHFRTRQHSLRAVVTSYITPLSCALPLTLTFSMSILFAMEPNEQVLASAGKSTEHGQGLPRLATPGCV